MLLVVASILDLQASAAVERWKQRGVDAAILTCHDLAQPGWVWSLDGTSELVVGGRRIGAGEIAGVITRIACVTGYELPFVAAADREYASSEMNAFLLALLTTLPCPVVNRPTDDGLCGPILAQEQWVQLAARARVAVRPAVRREYAGGAVVDPPYGGDRRVIHVVGDRAFDAPSERHERAAVAVAKAAGVELLRTWFDADAAAPTFVDADPWVDLSDPAVADAVHARLAS